MHQNRTTYLINPINLKGKHLTWSDVGNFAKNDVIKNEYCSLRGCFAYYQPQLPNMPSGDVPGDAIRYTSIFGDDGKCNDIS